MGDLSLFWFLCSPSNYTVLIAGGAWAYLLPEDGASWPALCQIK